MSKELWDKVQESHDQRWMRKRRRVRRDFAFGRMIVCGQCGRTLVGEIKKGTYIYYRCTPYKTDCNERYVQDEVLEENFTDILRILLFNESARCRCGSATDSDIQASPETYRHRRLPSRLLKNSLLRDARTHRRRSMHVSACFFVGECRHVPHSTRLNRTGCSFSASC